MQEEETTFMKLSQPTIRRSCLKWIIVGLLLYLALHVTALARSVGDWDRQERQLTQFHLDAEAPFPTDSLTDNLQGYNAREEASMFAPGSQQGIAIVRAISLSVTRANHRTAITPELALSTNSECIPDAMTTVHSRLNKIILSSAAEVVFESTDGEDACTTNSVEKRLMIPTDSLELFCEEIRQLVSSNTTPASAGTSNLLTAATAKPLSSVQHPVVILRDSSEVWELPNVNAADSASEMSVAFKTQQLRLGRYRALYDNAANMS
ncbi:transmembrane protein, putative, partial [Bodo saltans]